VKTATHIGRTLLLLGGLVLAGNEAAAQAPVQSFADLPPLITIGQRVIIRDAEGRRIQGEVVSLSRNQIEIERRRWFRRERQVFQEASVRRLEHSDSVANGVWIGVGIGALLAVGACKATADNPDDFSCLSWTLAPTIGGLIGQKIDASRNRALYASTAAPKVTLRLLIGRERAGLAAALRF